MKTRKGLLFAVMLLGLSLSACNQSSPKITGYSIDENNNVIVIYDNGSQENVGNLTDEDIVNHVTSVTISQDGYFVINGIKTDTKVNFSSVTVSEDGYYVIDGIKTTIKVGYNTITISSDGYYVVDGIKTSIKVNFDSVEISDDGYYVINGIKTDIKATNVYTVKFNTGYSASVADQKVFEGHKVERPQLNRTGYELDGWFCNGEEWRFNSDVVLNDMILAAEWTAKQYTVSFVTDGTPCENMTVTYDGNYTLPSTSKDLYNFVGWKYGNQTLSNSGKWSIDSDETIELVADWARITYKITFNSNGGSAVSAMTVPSYSTVESLPTPTRNDYEFMGWYLGDDLITAPYDFTEGNITLVARWHAISEDYEFVENERGKISIQECKLNQAVVNVPNSFSGKTIDEVLTGAFTNKANLKEINLPVSITSVGFKAIDNCSSLETLTICGHSDIQLAYVFGSEALIPASFKNVKIATGSTTYGKAIFDNLSSRNFELTLNADLTTIPEYAFQYCDRISKLHIPEGVVNIGKIAIANMDNLTYVNIPSTIKQIGQSNFINNDKLVYLAVPNGITKVDHQGLAATEIPVLIAEQSKPSGWSSTCFGYTVTEQYMKVFWGLEKIVDGDDFLYGLCKVGTKTEAIIIQRYSSLTEYPEYLEGYPVTYTNNDYTAPKN